MSIYASEHADALADVRESGASIAFRRTIVTVDPTTDQSSGSSTSTISGAAIELNQSNRDRLRAPAATHVGQVSLFFVPETIGSLPIAGDSAVWGGRTIVVSKVIDPIAPDGVPIAAAVLCDVQ